MNRRKCLTYCANPFPETVALSRSRNLAGKMYASTTSVSKTRGVASLQKHTRGSEDFVASIEAYIEYALQQSFGQRK